MVIFCHLTLQFGLSCKSRNTRPTAACPAMIAVLCRVEELSRKLSQQYDVAAELKRNLEAEAALHTHKVSCNLQANRAICCKLGCLLVAPLENLFHLLYICRCQRVFFSQQNKNFSSVVTLTHMYHTCVVDTLPCAGKAMAK